MGRRRKRRSQGDVELNLAAMLDMAFQLLTFFILTFRPAPIEGQISLRLPPPQAVVVSKDAKPAGENTKDTSPIQGVNTLTISIFANPKTGEIASLGIGETQVPSVAALNGRLHEVFADPGNPFDQVIVQVTDGCRYDELMKVIEICTHQVFPDGKKLTKLSFVEVRRRIAASFHGHRDVGRFVHAHRPSTRRGYVEFFRQSS
jgi:biopolymer transport protein ExbD